MENKIDIAFILPSLRPGGAERVMSFMAKHLNKEFFKTTLIIIGYEKDNSYSIEDIDVIYLNKPRVRDSILPLFKYLRLANYDIVISSIGHLNILMGLFSIVIKNTNFIGREASIISTISKYNTKNTYLPKWVAKFAYNKLRIIICQSADMAVDINKIYNIPTYKLKVINNPITGIKNVKPNTTVNIPIRLITVGRLSPEKGHLRILSILSKFDEYFHYTIIGDGPEKDIILKTAMKYGFENKITHIPFTGKVAKFLRENDVFLQGSFVEGFPNSVLESCSVGTPVIAFDVPGGTREIIQNSVNGFLVTNESDFLIKLKQMYYYNWDSCKISDSVYSKFEENIIIGKYESLLRNIAVNYGRSKSKMKD